MLSGGLNLEPSTVPLQWKKLIFTNKEIWNSIVPYVILR